MIARGLYAGRGIELDARKMHNTEITHVRKRVRTAAEKRPVPTKRAHAHQTPLFGPVVYAVGGALNHVSTDNVFIGRFE